MRAMQYYDVMRHWRRVRPHLADPIVANVLVFDFNLYTYGRWKQPFEPGMVPHEFESCDWWLSHRGRKPAFWQYVKHAACHWLVNFNLELAKASVSDRVWRVITSDRHSTVWDGEQTLFDMNFLALGVAPAEAYRMARRNGEILKPGEHLDLGFAEHYSIDMAANAPDRG